MKKILQTMLISAVFATSGMASSVSGLPNKIEAGAEVILKQSLSSLDCNVSNYGTITNGTEGDLTISSDSGPYTITNITSAEITKVTNDTEKTAILTENPVDGVTFENVYQVTYTQGTTENITEGTNVTFETDDTAPTIDPSSLGDSDLLYLGGATGSGKTVKIVGSSDISGCKIYSPFGDQDGTEGTTTYSYGIETSGYVNINRDISNYKNGKINITSGRVYLNASGTEMNSPIDVSGGILYMNGENIDIYSDITIYSGGKFFNSSTSITLKSGATLTIGATAE